MRTKDVIEVAPNSRARCKHCRSTIEEADHRFGVPLDDGGDARSWFHLDCASRRLPERLHAVLRKTTARASGIDAYDRLVAKCLKNTAKVVAAYPHVERAPTGRARCVSCSQLIAKNALRVVVEHTRESDAFASVSVAFVHPACAGAYLGTPDLAARLRKNSPTLGKKDLAELAGLLEARSDLARAAPRKQAPLRSGGTRNDAAELVFADQLLEKGDVRGEHINVIASRDALPAGDPRRTEMDRRLRALEPKALERWSAELGKKVHAHAWGFPIVALRLGAKTPEIPDLPFIGGLHVMQGKETALAALLAHNAFSRVKSLLLDARVTFTFDGLRGFCSCAEVKDLRALEVTPNLGPRALPLVLESTRFESLERLSLGCISTSFLSDARGFERVAGLPKLRALHFGVGWTVETLSRLLRSPLLRQVEEIRFPNFPNVDVVLGHALPSVRLARLQTDYLPPKTLEKLTTAKSLVGLESLQLLMNPLAPDVAKSLGNRAVFPSLRRLDVSGSVIAPRELEVLRNRFSDQLLAEDTVIPAHILWEMKKKKR
jgi:hypothetical protein